MTLINIRHLRAFVAVCELKHFTKAAETIHLTQPALSILIKQLESELGVGLVNRKTRSVEITEIGQEFYEITKKLTDSFEDALAYVAGYSELKKGNVTIAALPSLAVSVLPRLMIKFRTLYPGITVKVLDFLGEGIIDALQSKRAEIALTHATPHKNFSSTNILRDRLVLVGSPTTEIEDNRTIRWKNLAEEPIIAMARGTTIRSLIDSAAISAKVNLNIMLEPHLIPTAVAFARAGYGCAILPYSRTNDTFWENLDVFELADPTVMRDISILHLNDYPLSPAATTFQSFLIDELRKT